MNKTILSADRLAPRSLEEALALSSEGYVPVAGGTDLMVRRHSLKSSPVSMPGGAGQSIPPLFYTGRVDELLEIKSSSSRIRIGSAVSLGRLLRRSDIPPVLSDAAGSIASPGIRNTATLAGNICNASPAGDSLPALYVLEALIETAKLGTDGRIHRREIPAADFITGPGRTVLSEGELVSAVLVPRAEEYSSVFRKVGTRAANALSKLSIAAAWKIDNRIFTDFRLAIGACGPLVLRSGSAESLICGSRLHDIPELAAEIIDIYREKLKPIDDQRSTADYRRNTALRLIEDIINKAGSES